MHQRLSNALCGLRAITQFDRVFFTLCQRLLGRRLGWTIYAKGRLKFLVDHLAGDQSGTRDCIAGPMYRELFKEMQLPRQLRYSFPALSQHQAKHRASAKAPERRHRRSSARAHPFISCGWHWLLHLWCGEWCLE
ncbi:MAG: hypothetical protein NTY98_29415 [Verrucomicrobia bacterium]|nr:hypothetical protein [Verrucomicrobiota bacterium]